MPIGGGSYAIAITQTMQNGGFDLQQEIVSPASIQATAAADGLNSRVITAAAFDASGMAHLFSYGWQGDTTTTYDTTIFGVASSKLVTEFQNLAAQGYILTAFGGNDANGYVLVGTKVDGDALPRSVIAITQGSSTEPAGFLHGYAQVGFLGVPGIYPILLYEK